MITIWRTSVKPPEAILKDKLQTSFTQEIELPEDAEFLHCEIREGRDFIDLWWKVNTDEDSEKREIIIFKSGAEVELPDELIHRGTVCLTGDIVLHLFEIVP